MKLSDKVSEIPEALSIYINQLVYDLRRRGYDVTTLSLGEAFFDIPRFDFRKIDFNRGYHYSDSQGLPGLRAKIADYYDRYYNAPIDAGREVLISAGSKPIIFMCMQAVLNSGDEILMHEPAWLSYQEQGRLCGAEPKFIPYDCPSSDFARYFTDKTRLLILNNPNNPAGYLYSEAELRGIYEECRSRGIYLMVDEAYSDFVIGRGFSSLAGIVPGLDGAIVVNSLSKNMGISGWRVGYAITHPRLIEGILKLNQHIITCAPTVLQLYLEKYFDDIIEITLPQVQAVVSKRQRVAEMLHRLGLKSLGGSTTFYFFVSIEDFPGSGHDLCLYLLLKHGIATVPGSAYGQSTTRFVRVSVGAESEERIWEALQVFRDTIRSEEDCAAYVSQRLNELGIKHFND